ncbi:ATP synthase subunit I [Parageobacillus thermoglucosidasius]|uniref:ATP synthase subunit I n=1 Tax=Parageobacillus thermoglucosidasius TaxID=1426 RepID=A0AB38R271_PARTM|nr:ATP synthase subunit I [Parageobacillus thermoglucosidasius]UOE76490.1 ATP synthase subunit I [Parageobacillus thermoglucosidasius]GCD84471.1 ATP synthase protein I [Parageobacillus thermoglucosidasius]
MEHMMRNLRKYALFFLFIYAAGWGMTGNKTLFLSLLFGTFIGFYSVWLLAGRVIKFGRAVAEGKRVRSLGMVSRMALAAFAALVALRFPEYFSVVPTVVGLMTPYFVIIIHYFLHIHNEEGKRGDY